MVKKRNGTPRSANPRLRVPQLELILGLLDRIPGTHASLTAEAIRSGDFKRATEFRIEAGDFSSPFDFALALNSVSLVRKFPGFPGASGRRDAAIEKWRACEEQCRLTNERIIAWRRGEYFSQHHEAFRLARSKISHLLGPFRWSKVSPFFNHGPGSTTRLPYKRRHLSFKFGHEPETTLDNLATASAVIGASRLWCYATGGRYVGEPAPCFRIKEQSKVTTVPKDAFIDRVIAIEPDMNMFVQKGFGGFIRNRLKSAHIDLDDQSMNQILARSGSATGSLATLDLSSASDTVSYELVKELLPWDWFTALLSCRTHESRLPSGEVIHLQKFSAMGNGFTFELESLIFWALCSSVCSETIGREGLRASVYGDDIIVSSVDYGPVVELLEFCGFTVNERKSFASGPYRESCGKHYFHGHDVSPITITKEILNVSELLLLCNNIQRWCHRVSGGRYRDQSLRAGYEYCRSQLPPNWRRPRIPLGYGDGALIGSFDEVQPRRAPLGWDGWLCSEVLLPKGRNRRAPWVGALAAHLYKLDRRAAPPDRDTLVQPIRYSAGTACPADGSLCSLEQGESFSVTPVCRECGVVPLGTSDRSRERSTEGTPRGSLVNAPDISEVWARRSQDLRCSPPVFRKGINLSRVGLDDTFPRVVTPTSLNEILVSYERGSVFVEQWCDIGPWVP